MIGAKFIRNWKFSLRTDCRSSRNTRRLSRVKWTAAVKQPPLTCPDISANMQLWAVSRSSTFPPDHHSVFYAIFAFTQIMKKSRQKLAAWTDRFHPPFTSPKARFRADENIIPFIFFFFSRKCVIMLFAAGIAKQTIIIFSCVILSLGVPLRAVD